jgi:acetyltransferase-like isoleucine patch superfamily enzyme
MSKINYLQGYIKHIFNRRVSLLSLIDNISKIHSKSRLGKKTKLYVSEIGAYSYISSRSEITHAKIGKFCSIGRDCLVGLPIHSINNISTSPLFTSKNNALRLKWVQQNSFKEFKTVTIGNDVWVGSRVIIQGGVTIGDGSVIGAGALVTKDIPPYSIAVGIPAKVIKYRFEVNIIQELLKIKWWDKKEVELKEYLHIFNKSLKFSDLELLTKSRK